MIEFILLCCVVAILLVLSLGLYAIFKVLDDINIGVNPRREREHRMEMTQKRINDIRKWDCDEETKHLAIKEALDEFKKTDDEILAHDRKK